MLARYAGCVSWLELDQGVSVADAEPVLSEVEFERRLATMKAAFDGFSRG